MLFSDMYIYFVLAQVPSSRKCQGKISKANSLSNRLRIEIFLYNIFSCKTISHYHGNVLYKFQKKILRDIIEFHIVKNFKMADKKVKMSMYYLCL